MKRRTFWIAFAVVPMVAAVAAFPVAQQPAPVARVDVLAPGYPRPIEMHDTVWMAELTALEARDLIRSGTTTAIICGGGVEENGPYMVLDKHNLECRAVAEPIARKLGHALVAPILTIEPGDPEKSNWPGAPVVSRDTYKALLSDIATNLRVQGFKNIVLLGDNGGNLRPMAEVATALNAKWQGQGARMIFIDGYGSSSPDSGCCSHAAAVRFQQDILGIHEQDEGFHADYENTSVLMALDPNHVRMPERIKANKTTVNGVELLPTAKTIENGRKIIAFRADQTVKEIQKLIAAAPLSPTPEERAATLATHDLRLLPGNVHWGYYDATVKPVLRVSSGDTIHVETMVAGGLPRLLFAGARDNEIPEALRVVQQAVTERGPGAHPLTGPIYVEDAEPGDVLEVKIQRFEFLHPFGVSGFIPNSGTLPDDFPYARFKLIRFDIPKGTADFGHGVTLKLAPFFGSIGVAPSPWGGRIGSGPPGPHTGNLDNKELVAGSTLYLPIHARGALLSMGDAHAMQGDGEVSLTAVETSVRGTVQVSLRKGQHLNWPRAETPSHYITMGLHTDLDEAAKMAVREAIDFLVAEKGIPRDDAYVLCSIGADLHVTQLVDGTKGVHVMIPKSIFR